LGVENGAPGKHCQKAQFRGGRGEGIEKWGYSNEGGDLTLCGFSTNPQKPGSSGRRKFHKKNCRAGRGPIV